MNVLIPSAISAAILGALLCPTFAPIAQGLLDGSGIPVIALPDISLAPQWWLSGGFTAHPVGTAATLALLFLISLLFFSMEQAKGPGEDGGVLGSARIKTGAELVKGSVTWDGKASPKARGFVYGFAKGKYLFEPERHVLLDGSTGSGKTRFCLIPTIDLLTYGDGANGSEPVSIAVTDVKNELIEITGPELDRRGYDVLLLDTQNPYRGHRFNPMSLVVKLAASGDHQGAERAADAIAMALFPEERGQGSSHWTESARSGCSALILLVACSEECPAGAKHLATVNEVLCRGTEGEGADPTAPLKTLLRQLPDGHPARSRASQLLSSGGNELRSIISTMKVRLRIFSSAPVAWMTSGDDIDPERALTEKTAVFLHVLESGSPYNAICTIFVTQLITSIFSIGDRSGGRLRPITFVGDEWCAMDRVEPLVKLLTLGRSYGAFWIGAVQSLSLLGEKYGERSGRPAILSNCGVKVAMKLGDADDRHFFSELVGKTTRHTRGTSTSRGSSGGSGSTSFSEHADDLIHPWEWTEMSPDRDGAIVVKMGENGVPAGRAGTFRAPLADCTETPTKGHFDLGTREHEHARRLEYQRMLDERASRHKDERVPIWCPDFPKASTDAIDEDGWGAL